MFHYNSLRNYDALSLSIHPQLSLISNPVSVLMFYYDFSCKFVLLLHLLHPIHD